jgi:hypothetical protein
MRGDYGLRPIASIALPDSWGVAPGYDANGLWPRDLWLIERKYSPKAWGDVRSSRDGIGFETIHAGSMDAPK